MTLPVLRVFSVKQQAEAVLRAAINAANLDGAPASALKGLYLPRHRFELLPPKKWPALVIVAKSDGGDGISDTTPRIDESGTLHFNCLVGAGTDESVDLDQRASEIATAVCDTLLENTLFLEMFADLERLQVEFDDGRAGESGEYNVVLFQISMDLRLGQLEYTPKLPDDATDFGGANFGAECGTIAGSTPADTLVIRESFNVETS